MWGIYMLILWILGMPLAVFAALVQLRIEEITGLQKDQDDTPFWGICCFIAGLWPLILVLCILEMMRRVCVVRIIAPISRMLVKKADIIAISILRSGEHGQNLLLRASEEPDDEETMTTRIMI